MDKKAGTITSAATTAPPAPAARRSPLAIDTQGLRTDRLLQVSLEEKKEKKNADTTTTTSSSSSSTRLVVSLTKGRFSEDKKRFVERTETIPWSGGGAPPPFAAVVDGDTPQEDAKVVALGQVLDTQTGQSCTCFLVKTHASLFLCRIVEEEEGEEQQQVQQQCQGQGQGAANARPRPQHRVTYEEVKVDKESSSFTGTDSFALADGPCVVAWERRQRRDKEKEKEKEDGNRPKVYCWYQGQVSMHTLEDVPTKKKERKEDDDDNDEEEEEEDKIKIEAVDHWIVTLQSHQHHLGGGHLLFRVEAQITFSPPSPMAPQSFIYAWSSLEMPPPQSSSRVFSPCIPTDIKMHTIACICESAALGGNGRTFVYHASESHLFLHSTIRGNKLMDHIIGDLLCDADEYGATFLPIQMCAFLPPPLPSPISSLFPAERPAEYLAVLTHSHGLRVFAIFPPPPPSKEETEKKQSQYEMRFEPVWDMQGVSEILCGDFLGTGYDQLALLPLPPPPPPAQAQPAAASPSSFSLLSLASSTSASTIALTDLVHVWVHKTCWKREEAPKDLRDKAAYRKSRDGVGGVGGEKSKKKEREKQKKSEEEASQINSKRRPLVVEEAEEEDANEKEIAPIDAGMTTTTPPNHHHHQQQQQQQPPPIDQEKRTRIVAQIREALRDRLREEEAEGARLQEEGVRKELLLRESQKVLAAMAYQEVLPPPSPAACMSTLEATAAAAAGSPSLRSFASSLVPLDDEQGEQLEEEGGEDADAIATTSTHTHTPHFPITSHRIVQQEIDTDAQRVALDVLLQVRDPTHLRLEHLSLSFFSSTAPIKFTSSIIPTTSSSNNSSNNICKKTGKVRLQATFNLSPAFLDSTWTSKVTLCCAWRRLVWQGAEDGEEEMVYPPGAQPLQVLSFSAKDFWGMGASATTLSSLSSSLPLLWKLDTTLLPGEEKQRRSSAELSWSSRIAAVSLQQNACRLAAVDLPTLCTTLHNLLQLKRGQATTITKMVPSAMLSTATTSTFTSPFLQGLATTVSLLQQELDLLCTLVEGKQPEASHIRDVWLSQPALDMVVYLLDQLRLEC